MKTVIQGGTLVTSQGSYTADILIHQGLIAEIGPALAKKADRVVDAAGCLVFPGFIDGHTHFDLHNGLVRTSDDFETGTLAAVMGGTTTIVDFATQNKGETLDEALTNWRQKAWQKASCDYGFHMAITDWNEQTALDLHKMIEAGVTSFKLYMAYDALRVSDDQIYEVLKAVHALGGIVGMHCENGDLIRALTKEQKALGIMSPAGHPLSRPAIVEAEAVQRYLNIAALAGVPVNIVHLSTALGLEAVRSARQKGQEVYVETCPQYLLLDDKVYEQPGLEAAAFVLSPPLRRPGDQEKLWQALAQGEIDTIGTDHCSFNLEQKALGLDDFTRIPNGIPGVEHRPALLYTYGVRQGKITLEQMVGLLAENPARLFGMYPQKGVLQPGSDADVVIWDPAVKQHITARNQNQQVDYTPYEGFATEGFCRHVFLRGIQVVQEGKLFRPLMGHFVARRACGRTRQEENTGKARQAGQTKQTGQSGQA
jgi:dihydropyrimidinase